MKKLFLFLMALSLSTSMFADGGIYEAWLTYGVSENPVNVYAVGNNNFMVVEANLGTVSSFYIDSFFVKVWQADGSYFERVCVSYRIDGGEIQSYDTRWKKDLSTIEHEWTVGLNKDIAYDLDNGDHTLEVWFWGQLNPDEQDRVLSNFSKNYIYNFTKIDPEPKVTTWFVIGTFNGWSKGYELKGDDNALSASISVEADTNYEFKLIREVKQGERIDTIWYGLPSEGNVMKYGACTDWVAYRSAGESNQANVGLQTTKAGDYTFTVDVTNVSASEIAPKFSVAIPEPDPAIVKWFVMGFFNNWESGYELTGEDDSKSVKIAVDAKRNYEFKFIRVEENDTTWYGLPSEGNVMNYGACTDWIAYKSEGESNQANVGLLTTKSGNYEFTVDVTNTHNGEVAPRFSVEIPEPGPDPQSVSNWYVIGTFNGWSKGYELKGDENALSTSILVEADANYEFKLIREVKQGARIDTVWYGLPSEGNIMKYGACTDWVAYWSRDNKNQPSVGLQTTKAGNYTFIVDVTNMWAFEIAPKFSVAIPDPKICQLTVKINDILGGAVTGGGTFEYGTQVTVTANENSGYQFIKWSNGATYNPYKFTIVDDMELIAFFQRTEADQVNVDEVVVTPDENSANIQWPQVDNAYTYTLIIWADATQTEKVCTLVFDASGRITSINFNKKPRTSTSQTEQLSGFSFTVTGLEENTEYFYSLAAKDEHDNLIGEEEKGSFTTKSTATGVEDIIEQTDCVQKVLRNGQLYIHRNGEVYNAQGARVE